MTPPGLAVVTGGASGIGEAITQRVLEDHWSLVLVDPHPSLAASLSSQGEGKPASCERWDVTDRHRAQEVVNKVAGRQGTSITFQGLAESSGCQPHGASNCLQAAAPIMLAARGGSIVGITSSISAERGPVGRQPTVFPRRA